MILWLKGLEERVLNLLFPRRCVVCHGDGGWMCRKCEKRVLEGEVPEVMPSEAVPAVVSLLNFEIPAVRQLVHLLKYGGIREVAGVLVDMAALCVSREEVRGYFGADVVLVPVSTSRAKLKSRGYNQAGELARVIGVWLGLRSEEGVLKSLKRRESQVGKGVAGRLQVGKQFAIDTERVAAVRDVPVVLVDDVYTTGGTVRACVELLKECGVNVVGAIVMAHSRKRFE